MMDTTTHVSGETGLPEKPRVTRTNHIGLVGPDSIALYIDSGDTPLIIKVDQQAILGRSAPNSPVQPQVDLTGASAFEKGVSRLHAVIRRMEDGELVLQDMGSSNGTMIRGTRLAPGVPHPLVSGDRFRLGQLEIEIYFGDNGDATGDTQAVVTEYDNPAPAFVPPAPPLVSPMPSTRQLARSGPTHYEGAIPINAQHVFSEMGLVAEDIIRYLSSLDGCEVTLTLDIKAHKPGGFDELETNIVTDRSRILRFTRSEFKAE